MASDLAAALPNYMIRLVQESTKWEWHEQVLPQKNSSRNSVIIFSVPNVRWHKISHYIVIEIKVYTTMPSRYRNDCIFLMAITLEDFLVPKDDMWISGDATPSFLQVRKICTIKNKISVQSPVYVKIAWVLIFVQHYKFWSGHT